MWLIVQNATAFLSYTYRTRTLYRKGTYGRTVYSTSVGAHAFYPVAVEIGTWHLASAGDRPTHH